MAGLGVLMSAVGRTLPPEKRGLASGIVNAGGSFGQFAVVPIAQVLTGVVGWVGALSAVGFMALAAAPLAWVLRGRPQSTAQESGVAEKSIGRAVRGAVRDPSFLYLTVGFFVCGFHVAYIAGSFTAGWAIGRWRMKSVLSLIYAARGIAVMAFLAAPKTATTFVVFSIVIGFTYLATVPPTVGLVGRLHGMRFLATLFGIVMLSHQIGGFLGAWLGGRFFEATGSYDWMWYADIVLAFAAALIHLPISEAPRLRPAAAPA
jgi:predicted MFS family arabinose efflux permease